MSTALNHTREAESQPLLEIHEATIEEEENSFYSPPLKGYDMTDPQQAQSFINHQEHDCEDGSDPLEDVITAHMNADEEASILLYRISVDMLR